MKIQDSGIVAEEVRIDTHGLGIMCAYGTHINGGWCAVITFGVSAELSSSPYDVGYNTSKLTEVLCAAPIYRGYLPADDEAVREIAQVISEVITPRIAALNNK